MTRREKILSLLIGYLGNISVLNGYLTNIGSYVSHWDTQITPHGDTYDVNVKDTVNEHSLGHTESINIKVELSCKTSSNYSTMNSMILDIQKCIYNNQDALGTAISQPVRVLAANETLDITRDKDNEKAFATVEFNIEHRFTSKWIPDLTDYT